MDSQPLDKLMRIPFQIFGGVNERGEWNGGQYLTDAARRAIVEWKPAPDGRLSFIGPALDRARAGLIDRYGLDEAYVEREYRRSMDEQTIMSEIPEIMQAFKDHDIGADEARVLQAVLEGEAVGDEDMQKLAEPIRNAIDAMGQEAVRLGLISAESYERNKGAYVHRVYQKHETDQNRLSRWVGRLAGSQRKKIIGNQFKGRGLWTEVAPDRLMRDAPGFRDAQRGLPEKGEQFRILERTSQQERQANLPAPIGSQRTPRVLERVYLPADAPVPAQFSEFRDNGTWEVRGTKKGKVILWRDFTKQERKGMGQILDARYTIAKTYMSMAHDLATGRFYQDIATNPSWSRSGTDTPNTEWKDAGEYQRHWADPEIEWVKVPDTKIAKSNTNRYGALAGRFVRAEIWRDIQELERMQTPNTWDTLVREWKLNKTARSPVVHMNNVMSNLVFMDMADVRFTDLARGLRSMIEKDQAFREATENGAFGSDMIAVEIRDDVLRPVLEEIEREMQEGGDRRESLGQGRQDAGCDRPCGTDRRSENAPDLPARG
jgi:hypothetical protein